VREKRRERKGERKEKITMNVFNQWGAFYLFNAIFFATQIIGGAKEHVVLL